jgi:hypothetical protein
VIAGSLGLRISSCTQQGGGRAAGRKYLCRAQIVQEGSGTRPAVQLHRASGGTSLYAGLVWCSS